MVGECPQNCRDRDMSDNNNGCRRPNRREIGFQPSELLVIELGLKDLVILDADRIENDEVPAFVLKGVIALAEIVFVELLAVFMIARLNRTLLIDADDIMVSDGVVDLAIQMILFCLSI